jgi:hypothetical protein
LEGGYVVSGRRHVWKTVLALVTITKQECECCGLRRWWAPGSSWLYGAPQSGTWTPLDVEPPCEPTTGEAA